MENVGPVKVMTGLLDVAMNSMSAIKTETDQEKYAVYKRMLGLHNT